MSDNLESLRLEVEKVKLQREQAALVAPWWKRLPSSVPVAAILAAAVPITTGVYTGCQRDRELAVQARRQQDELLLQQRKQGDEMALQYLDRLKDATERERTLRFIAETTKDPDFKEWAKKEQAAVVGEKATTNAEIAKKDAEIAQLTHMARSAESQSEAAQALLREQIVQVQAEAAELRAQLKRPALPAGAREIFYPGDTYPLRVWCFDRRTNKPLDCAKTKNCSPGSTKPAPGGYNGRTDLCDPS